MKYFLLTAITSLLCFNIIMAQSIDKKRDTSIRESVPFHFKTIDGDIISSDNTKNKTIVVCFLGYRNILTADTLNKLASLTLDYKMKNIDFIFITGNEEKNQKIIPALKGLFSEKNHHFIVLKEEEHKTVLMNFNGFPAIKTNYVIRPDKKLIYSNWSYTSPTEIKKYIDIAESSR